MPAPPASWLPRLEFGQVANARPYLRALDPDGVADIPIADLATPRCDIGQVPRRTASPRVAARHIPRWLGPRTRLELGVAVTTGTRTEEITQVTGPLASGPQDADPGTVILDIETPDAIVRGHELGGPVILPTTALAAIRSLCATATDTPVIIDPTVRDIPIQWTRLDAGANRWDDGVSRMAAAVAAEVGSSRSGAITVRPTEPAGPAVWSITEGRHFTGLKLSRAPQCNAVFVTGDDGVFGRAFDDRRWSPSFVGPRAAALAGEGAVDPPAQTGYAPIRTRTVALPVATSTDAAIAARGLLVRGERGADPTLTVTWNPWLDWGDLIVAHTADGRSFAFVVTGLDVPVFPAPMTITVRSI